MHRHHRSSLTGFSAVMLALLASVATCIVAAESDKPKAAACCAKPAASERADSAVRGLKIPDITVRNEDGEEVKFYSDLVQGRVVVINGIFTTCTTICPPMGANYAKLQKLLDEYGTDVQLISISLDPVTDTPERLKAWAANFHARPGWTLVTGNKTEIDGLLKALQLFSPDKEEHAPLILIGNDARGIWTRTYGLAPAGKMAEMIRGVIDGPLAGAAEVRP